MWNFIREHKRRMVGVALDEIMIRKHYRGMVCVDNVRTRMCIGFYMVPISMSKENKIVR